MGRKDASATKAPVEQYRKQIGRQDYKKNKPVLKATRLKAEAKKTAIGIKAQSFSGNRHTKMDCLKLGWAVLMTAAPVCSYSQCLSSKLQNLSSCK
ncbi:triple QxxK/R motif-containing protein isoform X1 [Hyla sarda]|uniref:triple QxxK/R motif-containing protein isoform X1 n=1 Tax=Hyla sarda TaxID=327740 RepID=UPI0024C469F7|nr:triple QxxK/R motif-containing protein isoform X1 [Hyla sarda]XP_056378306.1 triple QxxK/R motif-containing protein isoform X1 [Hyla sarda]XP_056378307.1 triple QxxK/R motif-containing protein isoform X1 [Hyla sarda]